MRFARHLPVLGMLAGILPGMGLATQIETADGVVVVDHFGSQLPGPFSAGGDLLPGPLAVAPHDLLIVDFSRDALLPTFGVRSNVTEPASTARTNDLLFRIWREETPTVDYGDDLTTVEFDAFEVLDTEAAVEKVIGQFDAAEFLPKLSRGV